MDRDLSLSFFTTDFTGGGASIAALRANRYFLGMPLTLDEIVEETRQMPSDVVAELVDRIMLARHGGLDAEMGSAWKKEIDRRIEEIRSGEIQGIPLEESLSRARKIAGL